MSSFEDPVILSAHKNVKAAASFVKELRAFMHTRMVSRSIGWQWWGRIRSSSFLLSTSASGLSSQISLNSNARSVRCLQPRGVSLYLHRFFSVSHPLWHRMNILRRKCRRISSERMLFVFQIIHQKTPRSSRLKTALACSQALVFFSRWFISLLRSSVVDQETATPRPVPFSFAFSPLRYIFSAKMFI